jgi:ribosomal protein S18 acetylase RimI-like enzyme
MSVERRPPLTSVTIRQARESDLDALEALEREAFAGDRLSRRSLRKFVFAGDRLLAATDAEGLAGYALVTWRKNGRRARLYSIAVQARRAGRGVGRALLEAVEARALSQGCEALRLEVREDNRRAVALYERLGYRRFGRFEDYYEDGAAALRLEKPLATSPVQKKARR